MSLRYKCAVILLAVAAWTAPLQAQSRTAFEGTVFGGAGLFLNDFAEEEGVAIGMDNSFALGMHAGVRFAERFGVEGTFALLPSQTTVSAGGLSAGIDTNVLLYGGSFLMNFPLRASNLEPFLAVGAGAKRYDADDFDGEEMEAETDFMWNFGGGARIFLSENVAVRLEARNYMSSFDPEEPGLDTKLQNDVLLTAGLSFVLPRRSSR